MFCSERFAADPFLLADDGLEDLLVVAGAVVGDAVRERLLVRVEEALLDLDHVDLGAGDDDADERVVVSAGAVHGVVEAVGKVLRAVHHGLHNSQEALAHVAAELVLDGAGDVDVSNLGVLLKGGLELREATQAEDLVELGLVRAPLLLAGLIELVGLLGGLGHVHRRLLASALDAADEEAAEVAARLGHNVLLQVALVHLGVGVLDGGQLGVGAGADDVDEGALVGAGALHGAAQAPGVKVRHILEQGNADVLKVAAELALQLLLEVLAKEGLEDQGDLGALPGRAMAEHINDGLFVGAHALHGLSQSLGVVLGVEAGVGAQRALVLGLQAHGRHSCGKSRSRSCSRSSGRSSGRSCSGSGSCRGRRSVGAIAGGRGVASGGSTIASRGRGTVTGRGCTICTSGGRGTVGAGGRSTVASRGCAVCTGGRRCTIAGRRCTIGSRGGGAVGSAVRGRSAIGCSSAGRSIRCRVAASRWRVAGRAWRVSSRAWRIGGRAGRVGGALGRVAGCRRVAASRRVAGIAGVRHLQKIWRERETGDKRTRTEML
eukprot:m.86380 g.86380  ORF g.86380 m.86380 type:complete len:547 (+) comp15084_c0_seq8:131-1771(+)